MSIDMLRYEKEALSLGYKYICGIDEVGRGSLAGEIVAAAVILNIEKIPKGIDDSKKLTKAKRESLYKEITESVLCFSIAKISEKIIDRVNIYNATKMAMLEALRTLEIKPDIVLIDAMKLESGIAEISIIKGDSLSCSIAAASIIAKVSRDEMMNEYAKIYPEYGFEKHKGYGVKKHIESIEKHGPCEIHRKTFAPVSSYFNNEKKLFEL